MPEEFKGMFRSFAQLKEITGELIEDLAVLQEFNTGEVMQQYILDFMARITEYTKVKEEVGVDPIAIDIGVMFFMYCLFRAGYRTGHEDGRNGRSVFRNP